LRPLEPLEWEWTRLDAQAFVLFSIDEVAADPDRFLEEERRRRGCRTQDPVFDSIASRAEAFVVDADQQHDDPRGYPWLADRGRGDRRPVLRRRRAGSAVARV
jgi:hypothetical protein